MASEIEARRLAQDVALAVQAALLAQSAPAEVFAAFCDSRLAGNWGQTFGSLGADTAFDKILQRALLHDNEDDKMISDFKTRLPC